MSVDVWIPERTRREHCALLPREAVAHEIPAEGTLPERLGHGDFLVAAFDTERLLDVVPRLEGLRVVQTLSAGVDRLVDRIPPGITLCDASGVHDVSVAEWVVMAILASIRNLPQHVATQRDARWPHRQPPQAAHPARPPLLILGSRSL